MDRNSAIGLLLLVILVIGFSMWQSDKREKYLEEQAEAQRIEDSIALANAPIITEDSLSTDQGSVGQQAVLSPKVDSNALAKKQKRYAGLQNGLSGATTESLLETEEMKVWISTKGAQVTRVELKNYLDHDRLPVNLIKPGQNNYSFGLYPKSGGEQIKTGDLNYRVKEIENGFQFVVGDGNQQITHTYTKTEDPFQLDYVTNFKGLENLVFPKLPVTFDWETTPQRQERNLSKERRETTVYYNLAGDDVEHLSWKKDDDDQTTEVKWVGFRQQFFNTSFVSEKTFAKAEFETVNVEDEDANQIDLKFLSAKLQMNVDNLNQLDIPMQLYFGPNKYSRLNGFEDGRGSMVTFGGSVLKYINRWMVLPLFNLFERFTSNYGIIIFLLALFIKLILTPLTFRSYKSQAKMRVLQPEIQELKTKFKDDQGKLQQEQMKLYRKTGVSPFGGCLPMVLQMPILFAMYRFFPNSIELRQSAFLWADDLSTFDNILNVGLPFYEHVSLFTLLMAGSSLLYTYMNSKTTVVEGPMKMMQYFMPVMLIFIFNSLPAGLTYYYFLYNILSFAQTWIFKTFFTDEVAIRKQIEANKKKPKKSNKLMSRWEEAMKAQEQRKRNELKDAKGQNKGQAKKKKRKS